MLVHYVGRVTLSYMMLGLTTLIMKWYSVYGDASGVNSPEGKPTREITWYITNQRSRHRNGTIVIDCTA